VFDICDTLYYSNTTHDFIRFVLEREPLSVGKATYNMLNSKLSPLRYLLVAIGVTTGRDLLRSFNISVLKGKHRSQLDRLAEQFVSEYLATRRIRQTQERLAEKRSEGLRLVLCSASIEPIVAAVARELHIEDFVATSLRYDGDTFTGTIDQDVTKIKLQTLKDRSLLGSLVYAASDNLSDRELLQAAETATAIIHGEKRRDFWKKFDFEIINLSL